MAQRKKVTRTIVYEGDVGWVEATLSKSLLSVERPKYPCKNGNSISMVSDVVEEVAEVTDGT